jgi:oligogalacturonide lyase
LTDLPARSDVTLQTACLCLPRREVFFRLNARVAALSLDDLALRAVPWSPPDGFQLGSFGPTADGRHLLVAVGEDLSDRIAVDLTHGYIGFAEVFAARPLSRLYRVDPDTGSSDLLWEERAWIAHINPSPTLPHLLTFCHEGPWDLVRQRIWGLDLRGGDPWPIRPQAPGESTGHEYWLPDGERVAYHGWAGGRELFGGVRYDNADLIEHAFPFHSEHFHSLGMDLVVGDDDHRTHGPDLLLWRRVGEAFDGPRVLARHRSSRQTQRVHVHPCFTPDGRHVVYTSDHSGYGQICRVEVPEFEGLPVKVQA